MKTTNTARRGSRRVITPGRPDWNIFGSFEVTYQYHQKRREPTMASNKLADILKSKTELSDTKIERMSEEEAWQWIRTNVPACEREDEASDD